MENKTILLLGFILLCTTLALFFTKTPFAPILIKTKATDPVYRDRSELVEYINPNTSLLIAHVHMAKTGGTNLNGYLALNFERVCGHKGYSLDYAAYQKRLKGGKAPRDSYSHFHPDYNRGRVPLPYMDEIGYDDCDWLSNEVTPKWWHRFDQVGLEIHVPCRDPVDHLMSQCNHQGIKYQCTETPEHALSICRVGLERYGYWFDDAPWTDTYCYDYEVQFTKYIDLMGHRLEPKKKSIPYINRSTNKKRDKTSECIWKNDKKREELSNWLIENVPYYNYCNHCIGSARDLFWDHDLP